jgi:hypothetical protein
MHASSGTDRLSPLTLYKLRTQPSEIITSDASLSPFDADELSKILELINHLQGMTIFSVCVPLVVQIAITAHLQ